MSATPGKIDFKTHLEDFPIPTLDTLVDPNYIIQLFMGFALPEKKSPTILNENQRSFIHEVFNDGQFSNNKKVHLLH